MVEFTSVVGVPLRYDRATGTSYGGKGLAMKFSAAPQLKTALDKACAELWQRLPEGRPSILLTGGILAEKAGEHAKGAAFDFDGFWHGERRFMADDYPQRKAYYCGIQAVLMKHFGVVINWHWVNRRGQQDHKDHWHIDLSAPIGWRPGGKSCVLCAQTILRDVWGQALTIDGSYGAKTAGAFAAIGIDPKEDWMKFLDRTADRAFGAAPVVADPDKPSAWAAEDWARAEELGLLDGTRPHDTVTREELAVVALRLLDKATPPAG